MIDRKLVYSSLEYYSVALLEGFYRARNEIQLRHLDELLQENGANIELLETSQESILDNYYLIHQELEETKREYTVLLEEYNALKDVLERKNITKISIFYVNDLHGRLLS